MSHSDLLLIVTSRGRPESWIRLAGALNDTVAERIDVLLAVDYDDPRACDYEALGADLVFGERLGHIGSLNAHALDRCRVYPIVGQMGDDHVPRTKGWDQRIRAALATPGIAYGNDLLQGANLPTSVFFSSEIIQATGKFAPEGLWHLYADNYWRDLGLGAGCLRYLPDVIIEHLHPIADKSEWDQTYVESNASEVDLKDAACWDAYQLEQLPEDIAKVKAVL